MNNFQTILVATFLAFFVFGTLVFSGLIDIGKKKGNEKISGSVIVWGTLPKEIVGESFAKAAGVNDGFSIEYIQKNINNFQSDLTEAFANNKGPDLMILDSSMMLKNLNHISLIPYEEFSEKSFRNTYIDGAEVFLSKNGVMGIPLLVDPMVLYYNKNILTNNRVLYPPKYWNNLFEFGEVLTKKDNNGFISQSMIALGQYENVNHAKNILALLLLQSNNPIVTKSENGYRFTINPVGSNNNSPLESIVNFFMEFSNPSNQSYAWNRSLPNSFDMFTSDKLAFYIGYASELFKIQTVNPNLSFNIDRIPQTEGVNFISTNSNIYTLVVNNKSKNFNSAVEVSSILSSSDFIKELSILMSLPSARRSLLSDKAESPYLETFFESSIISKTWLDPDSKATESIFKDMIENSLSNKLSSSDAISKASNQLDLLIKKLYE